MGQSTVPLVATLACTLISCVLAYWFPPSPPHNSPGAPLLSVLTLWNSCIKWLVKFEISLQYQEVAGISIRLDWGIPGSQDRSAAMLSHWS